ncbi:uncharacterized protein FTJAE_14277 [Fusarium tjaetaba]|uniref:Uncharacterized protein n=1 Tax=Fusarium tjaetaba TaxID=1567544 RepID=A0A8H5Q6J7_9HYPO|nr:uncharacterized protein FTJAE_14277 [Fusarium tjaetaba]KAF5610091.1 hypothetical protein FTJAE_14277 [Fusarium tjaetaba]
MKQHVKTVEAKGSEEPSFIGALSKVDSAEKELQDAIERLKDTTERNERIEQELEVLSKSADQLTMMECKLDVTELTCGFEDFVEKLRLRKEAGKGCHLEDSRHEEEELRWKKKLEKAEQELQEGKVVKRGQNARSVTGTVIPDGPSLTQGGSSLPLHVNPSTPPLRRSPRGSRPSSTPGSSTASTSTSCSSGSSSSTVDSSPNTSGLLESPATPSRGSSDQVPEHDSSLAAGTSQGSLQIAPRPLITDDDEIADQLERDASQATNQQSSEGLISSAEVVGTASEAQGLVTCAPVSTASPTDQELLENEIGPESEGEEEEGAGSDDEYLPGRKPKARSKRKSKTGSRWKGKGVAREAPDTGPKQTKLDRYFS